MKKVKSKGDLYIIGVGPSAKKDRTLLNEEIRESEMLGRVKKIFYTDSFDVEDTEDTILNVVIDVEGSNVIEKDGAETEKWAYREETPEIERKAKRRETRKAKAAAKEAAQEQEEKRRKERKKTKKELKVKERKVSPPTKKVRRSLTPPKFGQKASFTKQEKEAIRRKWKKRREHSPEYAAEDIILQKIAEGKDIAKEEPVMRAALEGDAETLKRLLKEDGRNEEAVNAYKIVQSAGGDSEVLKVLRNNYRIREAALDGDLEVLRNLLEHATEPRLSSINIYKMAMDRGSDQSVVNVLKNDPLVRKFLRREL